MTEKKNGGTAFPRNGHPDKGDYPLNGMSLRDYFAAKAMCAYVNSISSESWFDDEMIKRISIESYKQADAMLKAREE